MVNGALMGRLGYNRLLLYPHILTDRFCTPCTLDVVKAFRCVDIHVTMHELYVCM